MSSLISPAALMQWSDDFAGMYNVLKPAIDAAGALVNTDLAYFQATGLVSDAAQNNAWYQGISPLTQSVSTSANGFALAVAGGGILTRAGFFSGTFRKALETARTQIQLLGPTVNSSIINGITPETIQFSAAFASLYYLVYGTLLDAPSVFAPSGVLLGTFAITGSSTGAFTAGVTYPILNGAANQAAPGTDAYGFSYWSGLVPMPQGYAPCQTVRARITTTIGGACTATITAPNQTNISRTWTGNIGSMTTGQTLSLTPVTGGDWLGGSPTNITITGGGSGAFVVETLGLR